VNSDNLKFISGQRNCMKNWNVFDKVRRTLALTGHVKVLKREAMI
jgi:hypothetical protein